jgi:hypothetical protein
VILFDDGNFESGIFIHLLHLTKMQVRFFTTAPGLIMYKNFTRNFHLHVQIPSTLDDFDPDKKDEIYHYSLKEHP